MAEFNKARKAELQARFSALDLQPAENTPAMEEVSPPNSDINPTKHNDDNMRLSTFNRDIYPTNMLFDERNKKFLHTSKGGGGEQIFILENIYT